MRGEITNEKGVKAKVKQLLDKYDWFWWMPPANGYGKAGISDFGALKTGVFMVVETKFKNNKPSPMQIGYLNSIAAQGGFAFVVNENTLEQLEIFLGAFDRSAQAYAEGTRETPVDGADMIDAIAVMTKDY